MLLKDAISALTATVGFLQALLFYTCRRQAVRGELANGLCSPVPPATDCFTLA